MPGGEPANTDNSIRSCPWDSPLSSQKKWLQQGSTQDKAGHGEVDDEAAHVDQRCHERRRGACGVEAKAAQEEGEQRAGERAKEHDPDQAEQDGDGDAKVELAV